MNYIGDAIEVMSTMSEDQYGAVVTSPPYNIGIDYGSYKDNMKVELAEMMIKIVGTPSKILDPFMGTGTTKSASQNLDVEADGIDLKEWT